MHLWSFKFPGWQLENIESTAQMRHQLSVLDWVTCALPFIPVGFRLDALIASALGRRAVTTATAQLLNIRRLYSYICQRPNCAVRDHCENWFGWASRWIWQAWTSSLAEARKCASWTESITLLLQPLGGASQLAAYPPVFNSISLNSMDSDDETIQNSYRGAPPPKLPIETLTLENDLVNHFHGASKWLHLPGSLTMSAFVHQ